MIGVEVVVPAHEPVGDGEAAENEHRRQGCVIGRKVSQPKELGHNCRGQALQEPESTACSTPSADSSEMNHSLHLDGNAHTLIIMTRRGRRYEQLLVLARDFVRYIRGSNS